MNLYTKLPTFLTIMLMASHATAAQPLIPVASQDETLVNATIGKLKVQAKIKTHEMQIGTPSGARPGVIESNCTYSKYPCSLVDRIDISVNGNPLFIPRSAFSDLADLNKAELKTHGKEVALILYGGDASESYIVKINFDATKVASRTLSSAMSPTKPLQETTYNAQVLGD